MKQVFFKQLLEKKSFSKKWLTVPVSFIVHGLLVFSLVIIPILEAETQYPAINLKIEDVKLVPPPLPQIQAAAPEDKGGGPEPDEPIESGQKGNDDNSVITVPQVVEPGPLPEIIPLPNSPNGSGGVVGGIKRNVYDKIVDDAVKAIRNSITEDLKPIVITSVKMPKLIKQVQPRYHEFLCTARIQGSVKIQAVTDVFGRVIQASVIKGCHPILDRSALKAVKQWIYEPYIINGLPKPVTFMVTVNFTLK